jgi:CRISPR type III-B/RAMP module RAMP protein Cmr6
MPIEARRNHLDGLLRGKGSNLGLYFNRYVEKIDVQGEHWNDPHGGQRRETEKSKFLISLCGTLDGGALKLYKAALENWQLHAEQDRDAEVFVMETVSPLLCGMGNKNALEIGATFMHPYGMPYIPGSAIKGVASAYAERVGGVPWRKTNAGKGDDGEASVTLFGGIQKKQSFAAAVDVLDAWWMPVGTKSPFAMDILTPHHKGYYAGRSDPPPPDGTESPTPVTFLVIKPGEKFLFAVRGQEPLRRLAKALIRQAFEADGAGGKTRSGYGRFDYVKTDDELLEARRQAQEELLEARRQAQEELLEAIRQAHTPEDLRQRLNSVQGEWHRQAQFVQACADALKRIGYSPGLDNCFKHALPARWLLEMIRAEGPKSSEELDGIMSKHRRHLNHIADDRAKQDVQEIVRLSVELVGKSFEEIIDLCDKKAKKEPWLEREAAAEVIQVLPQLKEEEKQSLIEDIRKLS